ncbi:hypothetical protein [Nonomuraea sp. NPDC050310]|uniref:hypothetical protein n=1 Tax=unclassified Nonomuraea TaxID=2593643 RepID=UPI0034117D8C
MDGRRVAILATAGVVAVLAVVLTVLRWDDADKIATGLSALAGVAAVGVAVWAGLPRRDQAATRGKAVHVRKTGNATATGPGALANTGLTASGTALPDDIRVTDTGDAEASDGGEAGTGARLD